MMTEGQIERNWHLWSEAAKSVIVIGRKWCGADR